MTGFTDAQTAQLLEPLDKGRVGYREGSPFPHLESWDAIRWLNRIFGFDGWDWLILDKVRVHADTPRPTSKRGTEVDHVRTTVVYEVRGRLIIKGADGTVAKTADGAACGEFTSGSVGDACDNALKTADSEALKRAARHLGDQFGLSLYSNGSTDPVVGHVLGDGFPDGFPNDPPVPSHQNAPVGSWLKHAVARIADAATIEDLMKTGDEITARAEAGHVGKADGEMLQSLYDAKDAHLRAEAPDHTYAAPPVPGAADPATGEKLLTKRQRADIDHLFEQHQTPEGEERRAIAADILDTPVMTLAKLTYDQAAKVITELRHELERQAPA